MSRDTTSALSLRGSEPVLAPSPAPGQESLRSRTARLLARVLDARGFEVLRAGVDLAALLAGVVMALRVSHGATPGGGPTLLLLAPVALAVFALRGLYRRRLRTVALDGAAAVLSGVTFGTMVVVVVDTYLAGRPTAGGLLVTAWGLALLAVSASRLALASVQRWARARRLVARSTLIVGAGHVGAQVARRLETHPEYGLRPVGYLEADPHGPPPLAGDGLPVLGGFADLREIAARLGARHVIFAFSTVRDDRLVPYVRQCDQLGLEVSLVPRMYESVNDRVAYESLGGLPLLGLRAVDPQGWRFAVKHAFDRVAAAVLLAVLAPLLIAIALAVRLESPGPVLFRQRRVGRDGRAFDLHKFRSMHWWAPAPFLPGVGLAPGGVEGSDRRTRVGRLLRRTSLDELPQLINVLRGEMSLVGPRPERPEFVDLFGRDIARYGDRHRVKSGITGWAQVHGLRGQTSLIDRVEWDNWYIAHWSLGLDVKILLMTLGAVVRGAE